MLISLIAAITLCGRISPAPLGSRRDREFLAEMRMRTNASLIGAGTLRAENPHLAGIDGVLPNGRIRAILTASGELPVDGKSLFQQGPAPHLFVPHERAASLQQEFGDRAVVHGLPWWKPGELSLAACREVMAGLGVESLLVEGGGRLYRSCLAQGVADELFLTLVPKASADAGAALFLPGGDPLGDPLQTFRLRECRPEGDEVFLRYEAENHGTTRPGHPLFRRH